MSADAGRSVVDVLKDIAGNVQHLVRSEIRLAKTELRDELSKARSGAIIVAAGGVLGLFGLLFALLAAASALSLVMPAWAAALLVAVVAGIIGGVLVQSGINQIKRVTLPPPRTTATIQETIRWAKTEAK